MTQSEQELEQNLIDRLTGLGYEPVTIRNAADLTADLTANLKTQLEKHNEPPRRERTGWFIPSPKIR